MQSLLGVAAQFIYRESVSLNLFSFFFSIFPIGSVIERQSERERKKERGRKQGVSLISILLQDDIISIFFFLFFSQRLMHSIEK
jgi:hypothetical protein